MCCKRMCDDYIILSPVGHGCYFNAGPSFATLSETLCERILFAGTIGTLSSEVCFMGTDCHISLCSFFHNK